METIYKNDELLELTKGSSFIRDSLVTRFDIYQQEFRLNVDVYLNLGFSRFKAEKKLKIHCSDIIRYQFLHDKKYYFYNVENCKFFKSENGYYLSLAPFNELDEISEEDEDLVQCENIEGYFI
jgi:hypothetical protein